MLAMVLERISPRTARPLVAREVPDPVPGQGELLLRVLACAVCRTDLHWSTASSIHACRCPGSPATR